MPLVAPALTTGSRLAGQRRCDRPAVGSLGVDGECQVLGRLVRQGEAEVDGLPGRAWRLGKSVVVTSPAAAFDPDPQRRSASPGSGSSEGRGVADAGTVTSTRMAGGVEPPVSIESTTLPPPMVRSTCPACQTGPGRPLRPRGRDGHVEQTDAPGATTTDGYGVVSVNLDAARAAGASARGKSHRGDREDDGGQRGRSAGVFARTHTTPPDPGRIALVSARLGNRSRASAGVCRHLSQHSTESR
jgi:hypothetical protein